MCHSQLSRTVALPYCSTVNSVHSARRHLRVRQCCILFTPVFASATVSVTFPRYQGCCAAFVRPRACHYSNLHGLDTLLYPRGYATNMRRCSLRPVDRSPPLSDSHPLSPSPARTNSLLYPILHVSQSTYGRLVLVFLIVLQPSINNRQCLEHLQKAYQEGPSRTSTRRPAPNMRVSRFHSCYPSRASAGARSVSEYK